MLDSIVNEWHPPLTGLWNAILCNLIALIGSLIIGISFVLLETSQHRALKIIDYVYVEVFRNIPLLVITMAFFLIIPVYVVKISGSTVGTIGLTFYMSAFITETVRAGVNSIGPGQMGGALANGFTYGQAVRYIVLPQAFRVVIPPLGSQFINLIKNSLVLAFVIDLSLMHQGDLVANGVLAVTPTYFIIGIMYLIITLPSSYYMRHLEKKLA